MILRSDLLDLLFEKRNKEYGAYMLRRNYSRYLLYSFSGPVLLLFLFWMIVRDTGKVSLQQITPFLGDTSTHVIQPPPGIEPPPPPTVPRRPLHSASTEFFTPVIAEAAEEPIAEAGDLLGDEVILGNTVYGPIGPEAPEPAPPATPVEPSLKEPDALTTAEVMPEFPGGLQAFNRFMAKHLRVPDDIAEPGTRIRLLVHFIVNKDGSLQGMRFADSAQTACQQEIRRVFQKMPKWIPGSQHGRTVAVHFTVPILFEIPAQ